MPEYLRRSRRLLSEAACEEVVDFLASEPDAGVLIRGTGGIRKLRWDREGMSKSGGVRVIYYYHDASMPLYLLTIFGKGEKSDLTKSEANELAKFVKTLVQNWKRRHE
jgi:hypothetical protein